MSMRLPALLIALAVALAYGSALTGDFVYDAKPIIRDNPAMRDSSPSGLAGLWTHDYWWPVGVTGAYRPLTTTTYWLNARLAPNRGSTFGFHLVNVLLHLVNALLVYALGLALFRRAAPALIAALLFAVHPVATEAVTNLVGRADELAALAVLGGLWCRARALASPPVGRWRWGAGLGMFTAVGLLSKETALAVGVLVPLHDALLWWPRWSWRERFERSREWLVMLPALALMVGLEVAFVGHARPTTAFVDNPLIGAAAGPRLVTALAVLGRLAGQLFWPLGLSADYSYAQIPVLGDGTPPAVHAPALALLAVVAALGIALAVRSREARFLVAFAFVAAFPTSSLVVTIPSIMATRFLYVPSAAWALLIVLGVERVAGPIECARAAGAGLLVVVGLLCVGTHARNRDWESDVALWTANLRTAPASYRTYQNLSRALLVEDTPGRIDEAIALLERGLAILETLPAERNEPLYYVDLGTAYFFKSQAGGDPWLRRAVLALERGVAIEQAINPGAEPTGRGELYEKLGAAYLRMGDDGRALTAYRWLRALRPTDPLPLLREAQVHLEFARDEPAAERLVASVLLEPRQAGTGHRLATVCAKLDPGARDAVTLADGVVALDTQQPLIKRLVAAAIVEQERFCVALGREDLAARWRALRPASDAPPALAEVPHRPAPRLYDAARWSPYLLIAR